jgi:hypothetical protein
MNISILRDEHQNFAVGFGKEEVFYLRKEKGIQGLAITLDSMPYPICSLDCELENGVLNVPHSINFFPHLAEFEIEMVRTFLKSLGLLSAEMSEEEYAESQVGETVTCACCNEPVQAFVENYVSTKGFYCFECI